MSKTNVEQVILRLENYLECWKQYNTFMCTARTKKFTPEDENQFLELKSVLTQEIEHILSAIDCGAVTREDVHTLISSGPSLRYLSELNDSGLRNVENQWHKLFISLQSILGQLKVAQTATTSKGWQSWFGRSKAA
jgi:REP element-mobilizing transposase RayT